MRHLKSGRKLGRTSAHRKALFNNLAQALVRYELIQTTDSKAKELRSVTDRLITLGKRGTEIDVARLVAGRACVRDVGAEHVHPLRADFQRCSMNAEKAFVHCSHLRQKITDVRMPRYVSKGRAKLL